MQTIKQGENVAGRKLVWFTLVDTGLENRLDASGYTFTVRVVKSDGTSGAGGGSGGIGNSGVFQPDVTNAQGLCYYVPSVGDLDTIGAMAIRISAAGAATVEVREIPLEVVPWDPYDPQLGVLSAIIGKNPVDTVTDVTLLQALRVLVAAITSKGVLPQSGNFNVRDGADTKNRLAGSIDGAGNRTITTFDGG